MLYEDYRNNDCKRRDKDDDIKNNKNEMIEMVKIIMKIEKFD